MTTANGDAAAAAADIDALLDALFQGPRETFVAERNQAARQLGAEGRSEDAARVKALTKPGVAAWAVNQLWWTRRSEMDALLDAARRQALALQSGGGPAEQAAAGQVRRRALDALLGAANDVLTGAGHATGAGTMRKISTSLEALAAHGVHGGGPVPGRLTADLAPPGFDLFGGTAVIAPVAPPRPTVAPEDPAAARTHEAQVALGTAVQRREAARERARKAAQALDRTTALADEATLAAQRAAQDLEQAQAQVEAARQVAQEAQRVSNQAQAHARREQQRAEDARRALEGLAAELRGLDEATIRAQARVEALRRE